MEITETVNDTLRREFRITVGMRDLDAKLMTRLEGMKGQVQLKGFRPGKVPVAHLRKTYGKSMMGEIVQEAVAESSQKAVEDRSLRPAMSPQIQMVSAVEKVIEGHEDLIFTMGIDLMPDFKLVEPSTISLDRPVTEVSDDDVLDSLKRLAAQQRTFEPKGDDAAAQESDQLLIDFTGKIDGIPFEGGTAENAELVVGSGSFIPGFEDQLKGYEGRRHESRFRHFPQRLSVGQSCRKIRRFRCPGERSTPRHRGRSRRKPGHEARPGQSRQASRRRERPVVERIRPCKPCSSEARAARRAWTGPTVSTFPPVWWKPSSAKSGRRSSKTSNPAIWPTKTSRNPRTS